MKDRRSVAMGAVFWLLFCFCAVLIRGIRWEESYERAQLLIGQVSYPAWHPFYRYARSAFTVQYYLSALILWLIPSPAVVCGFRQWVFLAGTTVAPYLLAARVSRRILYGHAAAVLTLSGVLVAFGSYYPMFVWPVKFTSGHIGMGSVLVALYLVVSGRLRAGFFLTGLMPAIHIGQAPVLMVIAALYAVWEWLDSPEGRPQLYRALIWGAGGFAVSGAVWLALRAANSGASGLHVMPAADILQAWRSYVFGEDVHRAFARFNPPAHGYIALGIAVFLGVSAGRGTLRQRLREPATWLGMYAAIAGAIVLLVCAVEYGLGADTPPAFVVWMPKRLLNHTAVLALALAAGIVGGSSTHGGMRGRSAAFFVFATALLWVCVEPVSARVLPDAVHARYVGAHEGILFLLAGAAAWVVFERRRRKLVYAACLVAGAAAVAYCHQFGGALVVVGFVAGWVASGVSAPGRSKQAAVVGGLCALALGIGLMEQWRTRSVLPVSGFEAAVRDCLDAHSGRGEFLLTPHWEIDWQEKTGHPVLYTYELPQYITYMPGLAPDILALRADIYDIRLGLPWDYGLGAWRTRSNAEWKRLAAEYGFSHVLSPMDVVLDLRRVMPGPPYDVYAVE